MTVTHYINRFDQYDYHKFGLTERWRLGDTICLLVNLHMDINGLHDSEDSQVITTKLYDSYLNMFGDLISGDKLDYRNVYNDEDDIPTSPGIHWGTDITTFDKDELLNYLSQKVLQIDVARLKGFISGEEKPAAPLSAVMEIPEYKPDATTLPPVIDKEIKVELVLIKASDNQYCFIKTAQSWNLQFGNVSLEGVKHLVGMDYIQVLLKNPGVPIGVYQIQAMLNPIGIKAPEGKRKQELEIVEGHTTATNVSNNSNKHTDTRSSKSVSLEKLKKRLQELSIERNELDLDYDHIDLERIDNECAKIEAAIDDIKYSKNDDPELKNNRDKVSKNIKTALLNIKSLEEDKGYKDAPMYNFLTNQIKAVSECIYTPPIINPPQWLF